MAHPIQIILTRQLAAYLSVPLLLVDPIRKGVSRSDGFVQTSWWSLSRERVTLSKIHGLDARWNSATRFA